jgi:hypothetical protein
MYSGAGILTGCPSTTPFGFALGSPNPWLISIAKETLGFRCPTYSVGLRLLMPTFSLPITPLCLTAELHCNRDAPLPPLCKAQGSLSSVLSLSPVKSSAQNSLVSKLLRTF